MNPTRIDHVGIAVNSIAETSKVYEALGLVSTGIEELPGLKVCFFPCGESEIELLESTDPESAIAKFIEKRGEGIQHIAIRVDDIEASLAEMKEKGFKLIDEKPRYGAGGAQIAFLHPKSTGGVLIELSQR